jgi:hypothetical protein
LKSTMGLLSSAVDTWKRMAFEPMSIAASFSAVKFKVTIQPLSRNLCLYK